ncbi:MAG: hypothetical protein IMW85_04260 [Thermicanus sp.]|nr:hypothetical protein [Thermicanus sp.]
MWIIPLLSSLVSLFFALYETEKYWKKRKRSDLLYALSLYLFTIAAFGEFYSEAFGWQIWIYKLYYFPAITLVPFMAAATLYIRTKPIIAHLFLAYVSILSLALLIALIPAQVNTEVLFQGKGTVGGSAMPGSVRGFSFWLSGIGGILLLLTSLWGWWRSRKVGFLYLFGGAMVTSLGGTLAKQGLAFFLPLSELFGILLLFFGVYTLSHQKKESPATHPTTQEKEDHQDRKA